METTREALDTLIANGDWSAVREFDTSEIVDFSHVFKGTKLNVDISNWDVSSGMDFTQMVSATVIESESEKLPVAFLALINKAQH